MKERGKQRKRVNHKIYRPDQESQKTNILKERESDKSEIKNQERCRRWGEKKR